METHVPDSLLRKTYQTIVERPFKGETEIENRADRDRQTDPAVQGVQGVPGIQERNETVQAGQQRSYKQYEESNNTD